MATSVNISLKLGAYLEYVSGLIRAKVGAAAGTLAAGDDARFAAAAQKASNLADLTNVATARSNLGLGSAATAASSAFAPASHAHPSTEVTDFTEAVQDAVAALLAQGTNVTLAYNDAGNTLTVSTAGGSTDPEVVRDTIGTALLGVGNITVTVNDAGDTITISTTATANSTDAALRDRGTHTGAQAISTVTGLQPALDAKLDAAGVRALVAQYSAEAAGRAVVQADHGTTLRYTGSGAATFSLPTGLTVGTVIAFRQVGTGQVTLAAGTGSPTLAAYPTGQLKTAGQGATIVAEYEVTGTWRVSGQTVA